MSGFERWMRNRYNITHDRKLSKAWLDGVEIPNGIEITQLLYKKYKLELRIY